MTVRAGFTLVGQVAGAWVGGPIGAAIGGMVGSIVGGAIDGPTRNTQALIDDLGAIKFDYGTTWPRVYGSYRVKIAPIWSSEKRPVAHDEAVDSKGGPDQINRTFTYEQDWLCWAPLNAKGWARIWINGKLRASRRADADDETLEASAETPAWADVTFYDGAADQLPWPVYEAAVGSADACAYRHRPTIAFASLDLGTGGQPPLIEVEFVEAIDEPGPDDDPLLLDVPFDGDASDVSDNPITPVIAHPAFVDYSVSGQATFGVVGGFPNGGTTIVYYSAKSSGRDFDRKFTAELHLTDLPNWTLDWGQGDAVMILGISGVNESATMGFRVVGGVLWIACGFADPLNPMLVELYPSSLAGDAAVVLRIVLNDGAAQRIDFYVNDTLLRRVEGYDTSYFTWSMGAADILGNTYHNDRISSFVADRFLAYYDEFPLPDVVTPTAASLADIVRAEALLEWTGEAGALGAGDIDVSALAAIEVKGFLASSSPREVVAQLADVFYFGAVCSDKLYMRLRGGASVATVPAADTGAGVGQAGDVFAGLERGNDLEQAIQVAVTGPNWLSDYEPGTENSDRLVGESVELRRYTTPVVFTPAERKGRADTMVLDGRVASHTGQVALDDAYMALECCDVWTQVDDEGNAYRVRAERENFADGVHTFDVVLDDPTVLSTVGITTERDTRVLQLTPVSDTEALLVDAPIVRDADDARGFYAVARRTDASRRWSGYSIFKSADEVSYAAAASGTRPGIFGTCSVVPGAGRGARLFDEASAIVVDVGAGTLVSATRDAILNDASVNAFAIGAHGRWLLGQFRDAELVGDGVYRLTGLLLGAGGTEQYLGTQIAGDSFVLLRYADGLVRVTTDATDHAATRYYKPVTVGQALSAATPQVFVENEVGKMPLSPIDARAARDAGDIALTWQRRSRLQVRMIGPAGILVPLGEETESYSIDVFDDDTFSTVVRTLTSTTPAVAYSAAQQTTDFGSPQAEVSFAIHQISAAVGRGFALRATL